jgi:hypothetical protein
MNDYRINAKSIVIVFSLCAVFDFVWSLYQEPFDFRGLGQRGVRPFWYSVLRACLFVGFAERQVQRRRFNPLGS